MPQENIKKLFKNLEFPHFIEKPSQESKNFLKKKGYENENYVSSWLKKQGWIIKAQNQKVKGIEIDVIAQKQNNFILVEVKSLYCLEYLEKILKKEQKKRLLQATRLLEAYFKGNWQPILAAVESNPKKIHFFKIEND